MKEDNMWVWNSGTFSLWLTLQTSCSSQQQGVVMCLYQSLRKFLWHFQLKTCYFLCKIQKIYSRVFTGKYCFHFLLYCQWLADCFLVRPPSTSQNILDTGAAILCWCCHIVFSNPPGFESSLFLAVSSPTLLTSNSSCHRVNHDKAFRQLWSISKSAIQSVCKGQHWSGKGRSAHSVIHDRHLVWKMNAGCLINH